MKMNIIKGLNRLWILATIVWICFFALGAGVSISKEKLCPEQISIAKTSYGFDYLAHLTRHCAKLEKMQIVYNTSSYWFYIFKQAAALISFPIVIWILGFGIVWVVRGFKAQDKN